MRGGFNKRSSDPELMDDFSLRGEQLEKTLEDLDRVNKWLGGNRITIDGIKNLLDRKSYEEPVRILDVGCGNGSLLKEVAAYGARKGIQMRLLGIDANPSAIEIARKKNSRFENISFAAMDVFSDEFEQQETDLLLCTLTLHHFSDKQIIKLLEKFCRMTSIGIVVNDLQRSRKAYYLFQLFCAAFVHNEIARRDGLVSIRRSFRKEELLSYGRKSNVPKQEVSWKWAFRYQWLMIT